MSEQENGDQSHNVSDMHARTPNTSPKRSHLKPVSPCKNGNASIGRLSFLQSDNIDDHFEHIHGSHEEILNCLNSLEAQSRQTQVDVEQLYDRSKNNNQNLNRVLSNIAEYSKEVTEEGNATKTDVGKILNALHDIRSSMKVEDVIEQLYTRQEETQRQLTEILNKLNNPKSPQRTSFDDNLLEKLSSIETQLGGLRVQNTFGEFRSRVESLAQENSKQVNAKLSEVLDSLQLLNVSKNSRVLDPHGKESSARLSEQIEASIARFESLLESQTKTIERLLEKNKVASFRGNGDSTQNTQAQIELQSSYDSLSTKHQGLQKACFDLELKYTKLEGLYDAKLELFTELQSQFLELGEESEALQKKIDDMDAGKYASVPELRTIRERDRRIITPLQRHSRITSMPANETSSWDIVINNSDEEDSV